MQFIPIEPEPARREFSSEDENFRLIVDKSASRYGRYSISTQRIDLLPGFGMGETIVEAMKKAKESLLRTAATIQERVAQLNKMIEEENSKEKTTNEMD